MLLVVPLFRGSGIFESLILSHHSRFTCERNKEEINDDHVEPAQEREARERQQVTSSHTLFGRKGGGSESGLGSESTGVERSWHM